MDGSDSDTWESDENSVFQRHATNVDSAQVEDAHGSSAQGSDAAALAAALGNSGAVTVTLDAPKHDNKKITNRKTASRLTALERAEREVTHKAELVGLLAAQIHQIRQMHSPELQAVILSRVPNEVLQQLKFNSASGCPQQESLARFIAWFRFSVAVQNYSVPAPDCPLGSEQLVQVAAGSTVEASLNPHALLSGTQIELVLVFGALLLAVGARVRLVSCHDANAVSGAARFKSRIGWAHNNLSARFGLSAAKSTARAARAMAATDGTPPRAPSSASAAGAQGGGDMPSIVNARQQEEAAVAERQRAGGVSTAALRMRNAPHGALVWLEVLCAPQPATGSAAAPAKAARGGARSSMPSNADGHQSVRWMHVDMLREWLDAPAQVCSLRAKQYPLAYCIAASAEHSVHAMGNTKSRAQSSASTARRPECRQLQYSDVAGPRVCGVQLRDVTQRYAQSTAASLKWRRACGTSEWWNDTIQQLNTAWSPTVRRVLSKPERVAASAQYLMALLHGLLLVKGGSGTWGEHRTEYSFEHILRAGLQAAGAHLGISIPPAGSVVPDTTTAASGHRSSGSDIELLDSDSDASLESSMTSMARGADCSPAQGWQLVSAAAAARADAAETTELALAKANEPLPSSKTAFKNHPRYALESLCGTTEVIHPNGAEHALGVFKGEHVYPRSHVQKLLTKERWLMEHGRSVLDAEVESPVRVSTRKVRAPPRGRGRGRTGALANPGLTRAALREAAGDGDNSSGGGVVSPAGNEQKQVQLYGRWQTEAFTPAVVSEQGKVPVNSFGNVEVWGGRTDMVPIGAVHLTGMPGAGRVASQLGFDWARAVVGFEFKGGAMVPKTDGIVVPAVAEDTLIAAWEQAEIAKAAEASKKRSARAVRNWAVLAKGAMTLLYIRARRAQSNAVGAVAAGLPLRDSDSVPGGGCTDAGTIHTLPRRGRKRSRQRSATGAALPAVSSSSAKAPRGNILDSSSGSDSDCSSGDGSDGFADSAVFGTDGHSSDSSGSKGKGVLSALATKRVEDYDEL